MRGVHRLAPSPVAMARLTGVLNPCDPCTGYDAHDVGEIAVPGSAPLYDRDEPEPLGVAKGVLHGAPAYPCPGGDLIDGSGTPTPVPVLICNDAQDSDFRGRERCSELRRERTAVGQPAATLA